MMTMARDQKNEYNEKKGILRLSMVFNVVTYLTMLQSSFYTKNQTHKLTIQYYTASAAASSKKTTMYF